MKEACLWQNYWKGFYSVPNGEPGGMEEKSCVGALYKVAPQRILDQRRY